MHVAVRVGSIVVAGPIGHGAAAIPPVLDGDGSREAGTDRHPSLAEPAQLLARAADAAVQRIVERGLSRRICDARTSSASLPPALDAAATASESRTMRSPDLPMLSA